MTDVNEPRTAREIRDAIARGETSAREVLKETLDRIDRIDAEVHSFLTVDAEHAYQQVEMLEARRRAGEIPGPLWGVPFSVKDLYDTCGVRTTYGSRAFADHVPERDAVLVARIRQAGGILVGKTNTPEFGIYIRTDNDLAPETVNPWDLTRTSGGSSGGAAASLAAGLTPIAVGSDGGGSIRIPAALCGVVGLKPSLGSIPGTGSHIGTRRFSAPGPMALDVGDAAVLWQAMHGTHISDPLWTVAPRSVRGDARPAGRPMRLRWIGESGVPGSEADVVEKTHLAAVALAEAVGAGLDEPGISLRAGDFSEAFYNMMQADRVSTGGGDLLRDDTSRSRLTDYARHQFEQGSTVTGAQYSEGIKTQMRAVEHLIGLLDGVDALVTPTLGFVAPVIPEGRSALPEDARRGFVSFTYLMNYTGFPAISVPAGLARGLPVGMQIIGRPGEEPFLLDLARQFQDSVFRMPLPEIDPVAAAIPKGELTS